MRKRVRCPVCEYNHRQFDVTQFGNTGKTEIEIKCRGRNCGALLRVTLIPPNQVKVSVVDNEVSQYPVEFK